MRSDDELKADYEFIVGEFVRFAQMSWEELRPHLKENALYDIEDAKRRKRIVGRLATQRLASLAEEALALSSFHGRVDPDRAFQAVRHGFGRDLLREGVDEPGGAEFREHVSRWIAEAGEDCGPRTYFVPCNIGLEDDHAVQLGPVLIRCRAKAWAALAEPFTAYLATEDTREAEFRDGAVKAAEVYYSAFQDIAEVTVPACDGPTSKATASATVQAALDFIHVMAGARYTRKMRGGGPAIRDRRGEVIIGRDGLVSITQSSSWGGAFIGKEWWSDFNGPGNSNYTNAMGMGLTALVERRDPELLADRFLDSCSWYGDASREPSMAAAVVKYLTAMERLLWAGETGPGVTKRIADRAAALCFTIEAWNMEELAAEVRDAYEVRSAILHGRMSKTDSKLPRLVGLCERVSRDLLLTWIDRYGAAFGNEVTLDGLRDYFNGFVREARAECNRQREELAQGGS